MESKFQRHKISYCPVCGYVDLTHTESVCDFCNNKMETTVDFFDEVCSQLGSTNKTDIEEYVRQLYVYSDDRFDENIMSNRENDESTAKQIEFYESHVLQETEIVCRCPFCNSTDVQQVATTSKVVNTAIFGIFGTKRFKQWHCNQCGSDF